MNPDDPQALESTLAAYRRLPQAEPAAALDAAIMAQARAAIAARPRARWPVLFATAATVLLGASLGWRAWRSGSEQPEPLVPPSAPAQTRAKSEPETAQPGRADTRELDTAAAADAPLRQVQERRAESSAPEPPRPAPAPTDGPREARQAREATASTPGTPEPLADAIVAFPASAMPPAASAAPAETPTVVPAGNAAAMESVAKSAVQPAIDTTAQADAASMDARDGQGGHAEAAPSPPSPSPAAMGALRVNPDAGASAGHDRVRRQAGDPATAEAGLQAIRELQRQGRIEEARQALEAWQADWPDVMVPEDLQVLLQ